MKDYEKMRTLSYKKDFSLKPILALLNLLDNPHHSLNFIHVAGTKGKTSVCHYLSLLAQKSQQTPVGLYTSPHLEIFVRTHPNKWNSCRRKDDRR